MICFCSMIKVLTGRADSTPSITKAVFFFFFFFFIVKSSRSKSSTASKKNVDNLRTLNWTLNFHICLLSTMNICFVYMHFLKRVWIHKYWLSSYLANLTEIRHIIACKLVATEQRSFPSFHRYFQVHDKKILVSRISSIYGWNLH